jgi:hypothetical protein
MATALSCFKDGHTSKESILSIQHLFSIVLRSIDMKATLDTKILNLLLLHEAGLRAPDILVALKLRVSQPTLWRALEVLRTRGAVTVEGRARATRYYARARTDIAALRSKRLHESVAKLMLRDPSLRTRALERLGKLRAANPHGRRYHDRWQELLEGPLVDVLRVITESSETADVLRKESPLSVFVPAGVRRRIFESTRRS